MDANRALALLEACAIEPPAEVDRVTTAIAAIRDVDAGPGPVPMANAQQLGAQILAATLPRGEPPDVLSLIAASRAAADRGLAYEALEQASELAQSRLDGALMRAASQLLASTRAALEALYADVRALPADVPATSEQAVHGDPERIAAFKQLEKLAARYAQLRALHRELVSPIDANAHAFLDTNEPPELQGGGWIQAGGQGLARLLWLAQREAFVPTADEALGAYQAWRAKASSEQRPERVGT